MNKMNETVKGYPLFVAIPCPICEVMQIFPVKKLENGCAVLKETCRECGTLLEITLGSKTTQQD